MNKEELCVLKEQLSQELKKKRLRATKYFLSIEVLRSKEVSSLAKGGYILDLLAETGIVDYKCTKTPTSCKSTND